MISRFDFKVFIGEDDKPSKKPTLKILYPNFTSAEKAKLKNLEKIIHEKYDHRIMSVDRVKANRDLEIKWLSTYVQDVDAAILWIIEKMVTSDMVLFLYDFRIGISTQPFIRFAEKPL